MGDAVNHPAHYGGENSPYEAIKVIEAWGLGFNIGNTVKYISRAGLKDPDRELEDLQKAAWYLNREIENQQAARAALKAQADQAKVEADQQLNSFHGTVVKVGEPVPPEEDLSSH